jgi:thiamine-phosphate pyrophosphorylase
LHAIVDVDACRAAGWNPPAAALEMARGGAALIQIRAKSLESAAILALCREVLAALPTGVAVIVNDRADIARLAGAAGVHVGQEDFAPDDVRTVMGREAIVGLSTHSVEQAERAILAPISYLAVGPVFSTTTKATGYQPVGLDLVRAVARMAGRIPVVAIGGITIDTAPSVLAAGATSVAIIGDLLATGRPRERVAAYLQRLPGRSTRPS